MTAVPSVPRRLSGLQIVGWMMVLGGAVGFGGGLLLGASNAFSRSGNPALIVAAVFNIGLLAGSVVSIPYWRRIDEAAREAHKAAWLWGGGIVSVLAVGAAAMLYALQPPLRLPAFLGEPSSATWVAVTLSAFIYAQMTGYGVVWALWWLRKR